MAFLPILRERVLVSQSHTGNKTWQEINRKKPDMGCKVSISLEFFLVPIPTSVLLSEREVRKTRVKPRIHRIPKTTRKTIGRPPPETPRPPKSPKPPQKDPKRSYETLGKTRNHPKRSYKTLGQTRNRPEKILWDPRKNPKPTKKRSYETLGKTRKPE